MLKIYGAKPYQFEPTYPPREELAHKFQKPPLTPQFCTAVLGPRFAHEIIFLKIMFFRSLWQSFLTTSLNHFLLEWLGESALWARILRFMNVQYTCLFVCCFSDRRDHLKRATNINIVEVVTEKGEARETVSFSSLLNVLFQIIINRFFSTTILCMPWNSLSTVFRALKIESDWQS